MCQYYTLFLISLYSVVPLSVPTRYITDYEKTFFFFFFFFFFWGGGGIFLSFCFLADMVRVVVIIQNSWSKFKASTISLINRNAVSVHKYPCKPVLTGLECINENAAGHMY